MDLIVVLPIVLLFLFLGLGMPIAFAMAISGAVGLFFIGGWNLLLAVLKIVPHEHSASYLLSAIPMFTLMAHVLAQSNLTKDLFYATNKWFGNLPGGLAIGTVLAGAGFAAISGSSTAAAAALSASSVPEMKKCGYKTHFALGVSSISGTLAVMIPPSIALILYGILTDTGIGSLLIAGIIPGIITALGYIVTILIMVKLKPDIAPQINRSVTMKERFESLKGIWPVILLVLLVIGGIYGGVVTATEAGALGAFGAFAISLAMRRLKFRNTQIAVKDTLRSSVMIFTIIIGAVIFGQFLTMSQVTQNLIQMVTESGLSKWHVLIIVLIVYIILGFFMDQTAILILTLPLTFPLMISMGFDPIWFGIIVTKAAEIGLVTPPVGLNVFVAAGTTGEKIEDGFKGIMPFVITDLIILVILVLFPALATWLPSMML